MEYCPGWTFPTPDSMNTLSHTPSPSPFSSNVSSYFRRPAKVVKPSSRNTSPKHVGRRRTATTNLPLSRTRSVTDKQRASMQHQAVRQKPSRPVSWHPNAYPDFQFNEPTPTYYNHMHDMYPQPDFYSTATVNGLITPLSQPAIDEPQIQELIQPLEGLSAAEMGQPCDGDVYGYQYWPSQDMAKQYPAMDNMFAYPMLQPSWQWNPPMSQEIPTAPSSPAFLPIQGTLEASPLDLNIRHLPQKPTGDDLVSLGLYDSPAEVRSSSLLFGGSGRKRSLKLEESFEPPPPSEKDEGEDDSDAEADEADDSETAAVDTVPFPDFHEDLTTIQPGNMAGQSFFFETEPTQMPQQQMIYPSNSGVYSGGLLSQGMGYGWF